MLSILRHRLLYSVDTRSSESAYPMFGATMSTGGLAMPPYRSLTLSYLMVCHYIAESFSWLQGPWTKLKDLPFTVPVGATCQVLDNNLVVVAGN